MFDRATARAEIDVSCTIDAPEESETVRVGDRAEQELALFLEALATILEPDGTIACSCTSISDQVTCRLTASPAALPEAVEAALFEPIERKSGLKFYLAETAIDAYANVRLDQNCDGKVIFEIDFETVSTDGS
ncbi:hypothetical protein [Halorhabdus tiamatea]|nr:hypothetical protein [Halorhabdus tiamatea]